MASSCKQCGALLADHDEFCTKCGAPRRMAAESAAQRFCTACGAALPPETKFCTNCGATARANAGAPASTAPFGTDSAVRASATPIPRIPKAVVLGLVALVAVLIAAGIISAIHRGREKAEELKVAENLRKLAAGESESAQRSNPSSGADVQKNLAELQAAANALGSTSANASSSSAKPPAPHGWTLENGKLVPAGPPKSTVPSMPKADPVVPVAATGNQSHDWALRYERTVGGPEADLVVRTGDINNLSFGWPPGFDPFSGKSTPGHPWPEPDKIPPGAPDGTDRIMLGSVIDPTEAFRNPLTYNNRPADGYSGILNACDLPTPGQACRNRVLSMPQPIELAVGALPPRINAVLFQIFADDFQPMPMHSHFQVSVNGTRIPTFEYAINALDQSGPIGKLLTLKLLPEYWPLLNSGAVKLLIDDPTTNVRDGYAVDFVRILVNPHKLKYEVSLSARVVDADRSTPIRGATVTAALGSAATDNQGKCELKGLPAGLVVATASAPGYDENSVPVDLPAGQSGSAELRLHKHQESTAALEQSIEQTGTATIYGIHFDTNSSKLRPDSLPALNAVLGLIHNHPGSHWIISGHTDNQGSADLNQPLSEARAKSVITWLKQHDVDVSRLEPRGFGATRPVADNATANGRALNRRVEVALAK